MQYGSWLHQGVNPLLNHQCYTRYAEEVATLRQRTITHDRAIIDRPISEQTSSDLRDEDSEQTGDEAPDTTTTVTSCERSSSADIFRLEFAATQWSKLVSNAEGLFTKLMTSNILPHTEQDQIEQWLCLKAEYEECIASDDTASNPGYQETMRRSLERIEEVTETDEKTDESGNRAEFQTTTPSCSTTDSEMSEDEDEEEQSDDCSDTSPDFLEKLDECMNKFKTETDRIINTQEDGFRETNLAIISTSAIAPNNNNEYVPIIKPIPIRNPHSRRNSMLPGSEMCNEVMVFQTGFRPSKTSKFDTPRNLENGNFDNSESRVRNANKTVSKKENSPDLLIDALRSDETPDARKTLKSLSLINEAKQTQVKKIQSDIADTQTRIEDLQTTIKIKERFIADMIKNSEIRASAKEKFERKRNRLDEEYYNARKQLAQAKNASMYKNADERTTKKDIEVYKNMAIHYEKRMSDLEKIKEIADDSAKKLFELESSLNSSKKHMEKLKRQLSKDEERKNQLESEILTDQKTIRELEETCNSTVLKLKEAQSESEDERNGTKNLLEVSARLSHLEHVLNEKSLDLERTGDTDEKAAQALRREIHNLRRTKTALIDEKAKLGKESTLTTLDERKLLECGETIEAIDAMIERKNEMICGRKDDYESQAQRDKSERTLMDRLSKLSEGEMRALFYKYFLKVIDLKESSRCLETQTIQLETHVDWQKKSIQALKKALKDTQLDAERTIIIMQREQEERLHLFFRHIAEESGSSGHEKLEDRNSELAKYKRENKALRRRLEDVESLWQGSPGIMPSLPMGLPQQQEFKQITTSPPTKTHATTKVTRRGNKLIIQKTGCEKRDKKKEQLAITGLQS